MTQGEESGIYQSATATHATSAVATITGTANRKFKITDISGSSDKAGALILVKSGSTTIWQNRISNTCPYDHTFRSLLVGATGADVSVTVDGTALCNSNISGFFI